MAALSVTLAAAAHRPSETLEGKVSWESEAASGEITLELLWHTSGIGTENVEVVATRKISRSQTSGSASFSFQLPESPYSCSGKLVSILWRVQARDEPSGLEGQTGFILSPSGKEVVLSEVST